jgi:hypothetical protein
LWKSIANPNRDCNGHSHRDCNRNRDSNRHTDGDRDGHSHRNSNGHVNSYSYAKTHSNPETPSDTKAPSDPTASAVTDARLGFQPGTQSRWNALSPTRWLGSGIAFGRLRQGYGAPREKTIHLHHFLKSDLENRFQRKLWIEMIGSQPVAIEER